MYNTLYTYGVATVSRLFKMIGLFCKRALYKRLYSTKETYNFKEPTNVSQTICVRVDECTHARVQHSSVHM